jgi:hypothetical protein
MAVVLYRVKPASVFVGSLLPHRHQPLALRCGNSKFSAVSLLLAPYLQNCFCLIQTKAPPRSHLRRNKFGCPELAAVRSPPRNRHRHGLSSRPRESVLIVLCYLAFVGVAVAIPWACTCRENVPPGSDTNSSPLFPFTTALPVLLQLHHRPRRLAGGGTSHLRGPSPSFVRVTPTEVFLQPCLPQAVPPKSCKPARPTSLPPAPAGSPLGRPQTAPSPSALDLSGVESSSPTSTSRASGGRYPE